MKKILMLSLVLVSFISYGQEAQKKDKNFSLNLKQKQRQSIDFILYYGTTDKFGFDFNLNTKTNFVWGFGFSGGLKGGIGKNYSETMGPNAFSSDIYEIKVRENLGLYGTFGYAFDNLTIGAKLGYGSSVKFFNAYDKLQILAPNGYYYTSQDAGGKVLSGVFMSYKLKTTLSPYFGYDNFNGANFGMFFRF
jgi:opacity protein-like surface antigen